MLRTCGRRPWSWHMPCVFSRGIGVPVPPRLVRRGGWQGGKATKRGCSRPLRLCPILKVGGAQMVTLGEGAAVQLPNQGNCAWLAQRASGLRLLAVTRLAFPVLLIATIGLIGHSHLNQARLQGRVYVLHQEPTAMVVSSSLHQLNTGCSVITQPFQ